MGNTPIGTTRWPDLPASGCRRPARKEIEESMSLWSTLLYAAFEAGEHLLDDGGAFLGAVSARLELSRAERKALAKGFARQFLVETFGEELTRQFSRRRAN